MCDVFSEPAQSHTCDVFGEDTRLLPNAPVDVMPLAGACSLRCL